MKRLEQIRLEVDSRRRTEADLSMKVEKLRDNLPRTGAKGNEQMQDTIRELQHKQNKLAGACSRKSTLRAPFACDCYAYKP
jgi:chaperonin cofactor prefoldin